MGNATSRIIIGKCYFQEVIGKCYFQEIFEKGKYMKYQNIRVGHFISRPNRFIAKIEIEGAEETVHVKNTGRCAELLVPGAEVYVQDSLQEAEDWLSDNELLVQNLRILGKNVRRAGT